jgi:hypothetical protein
LKDVSWKSPGFSGVFGQRPPEKGEIMEEPMEEPVVFLHGFPGQSMFDIIKGIKKAAREAGLDPGLIAFASSTPVNVNWKVKNLIREVRGEHEMMKKRR